MAPQSICFGVVPPPSPHLGAPIGRNRYVIFGPKTKAVPAPTPEHRPSANKRRKAIAPLQPAEEQMSVTMTPLNVTIVARCALARSQPTSPPNGSTKKRNGRDTPAASPTPPAGPPVHPYSRTHDIANTRSTVPSPHEVARAERMEEEKARQKKENAAAARAAAAIARRRRALRSGGRGTPRQPSVSAAPPTMIPPIQRAVAAQRAKSAEAAAAEAQAAEAAAAGVSIPTAEPEDDKDMALPHRALKRTRSSGYINGVNGNGAAVGSPLRTVITGADDDAEAPNGEDGPTRKRSRLAELPTRSTRRAASVSPVGSVASLPDQISPRKGGLDPSSSPNDSLSMRRVVSATDTAGVRRAAQRIASAEMRERSTRAVQLPARMRDYDR